jgi:8-oxo-dGTP pyrophosphatase MutT (NUDIX family)
MGKSVLSGAAIIYEALEHSRDDAEIKILHADMQNPYLSERIARRRSSDYREWREDINYAVRIADRLQSRLGARLELRRHAEGYFWRFFLFDQTVYVQPYLFPRDNAHRAPVLKFGRDDVVGLTNDDERSLYYMFETYFDLKWDECAPVASRLDDMVPADEPVSVVALAKRSHAWVFVVPKRFLSQPGAELPFHSIGGKRKPGEEWIEALQREAMEEIGARLEIKSSRLTRDITTSAEFESLELADSPRPYCVYKRTRELDPEVTEREVLWIIGYEADVSAESEMEPRAEIAAIVMLSPNMLRRAARERITYEQIRRSKDGSGIVIQAGVDFDLRRVAVPAGLAALPTFATQSGG